MSKVDFQQSLLNDALELINSLRVKKYSAVLYKYDDTLDEADLLIISEELPSNTERRQVLISTVSCNYLDIEVVGWTYDDYKKRSRKARAFIKEIVSKGIVLKDDYDIFKV